MARKTDTPASDYGEPRKYDPNFRGPIHNRSCTDVACCFIFIIVIIGYIALGTVAWSFGDPRKVVYPTDSRGQFCGQKGIPNSNKTILFYFNILKCANPAVLINLQCPTTQLCVSKCPDRFARFLDSQSGANWEYYKQFCKPDFVLGSKPNSEVLRDEDCPSMIVPSKPFLQRCFPDFNTRNGIVTVANQTVFRDGLNILRNISDLQDAAVGINNLLKAKQVLTRIIEDYANTWHWILIGLVITMVLSLLFILLLRYIAGVLLWLIIFGVVGAIGYGIWHCYWEYSTVSKTPGSDMTISEIGFQQDFSVYLNLSQTWLIFLCLLAVIEGIIVIVLIFLRKRICIAIALLKEASRAIGNIMSTLFYPLVTFLLVTICIAYWAVTAVFLASSGEAIYKVSSPDGTCMYDNSTCNPTNFSQSNISKACPGSQCNFAFYGGESLYHKNILVFQFCNLFAFLWMVNFTIALGQCTLAGAFASYYWALKKPDDIPPCPLLSSFSRAIRFHTGSLAFGSLILATVQFIRIVLEDLDHRLKGAQNKFAKYLLKCLKCCFWCLEHFIKFLNRNAYIMIAIHGKNFCTSAKEAFFLLMRNILRVAVLDKVTDFLLFLGKLLISGGVGALGFFVFTHRIPYLQQHLPVLNYIWVPVVTIILGSFIVAQGFFNVYSMCVDTLFLCFLYDLETNDGTPERPYYMDSPLRRILNKKNLNKKNLKPRKTSG
ncbi:choline transporter-like protein 5-B isoform X1 [Periophthalmus magnuspinnatus]|uniref:choline transporter-like protein 5-B isoform X1 n=1 Tax=Periophthalmus magnuspinnatus TaxID=409849 RepID=UPI002436DAD0|nr:choline transporter-like protein 5-B isoform X1 [Periophthalmus magnuspinnatus]